MKKDKKIQKKSFRLSSETIREMTLSRLVEVVGGTNGCGSGTSNIVGSVCNFCQR